MWRRYDWECQDCGQTMEHMLCIPEGQTPVRCVGLRCQVCRQVTVHRRLISMPAEYHGERVRSPMVAGGRFDTMGQKALPALPSAPAGYDGSAAANKALFRSPEWREARKERAARQAENKMKQARAAAIEAGANINMRTCRLPGDPRLP